MDLKEAIKTCEYLHRTEATGLILKAAKAHFESMPPAVWVPPKGMIVQVGACNSLRKSRGMLHKHGIGLRCRHDMSESPVCDETWAKWSLIPNLVQFTEHDGSGECPCEDEPIRYMAKCTIGSEVIALQAHPRNLDWETVARWAYVKDSILGE